MTEWWTVTLGALGLLAARELVPLAAKGVIGAIAGRRQLPAATSITVNAAPALPAARKHDTEPPDSPSPSQADRELTRRAARAAGFRPGDTGSFGVMNSIGPMRCDAHQAIVQGQDAILQELRAGRKETNDKLDGIADALIEAAEAKGKTEARLDGAEANIERLLERRR